jgi:ABC-type lipoprotein export system ATPase subunit
VAIIRTHGLVKEYSSSGGTTRVLDGINLTLEKGDVVAIVGHSGCGKTTLLNILGGLDRPTSGKLYYNDIPADEMNERELAVFRNKHIGYLFQSYLLQPRRSVSDNVVIPLLLAGVPLRVAFARVREALAEVGLADYANAPIGTLSGGQKQRVALARAIANRPEVLLVDEPTGNLDSRTSIEVFELLLNYNRTHNATVVIVTHDPLIEQFSIPLMTLENGKLVVHVGKV